MKLEYILLIIVLLHYLFYGRQEVENFGEVKFNEDFFAKSLLLYLKTQKYDYLDYLIKLQELMVEVQGNQNIYSEEILKYDNYLKLKNLGQGVTETDITSILKVS